MAVHITEEVVCPDDGYEYYCRFYALGEYQKNTLQQLRLVDENRDGENYK